MKDLSKVYDMKVPGHYETAEYVFFWSGPFSNWHPSSFKIGEIEFNCSEQAMMYYKAREFSDTVSMDKILLEVNPSKQKKLGRAIANYDERRWADRRESLSDFYLEEKFYQNQDLMKILLDTDNKIICEASPFDPVWGIAMGVDKYPEILDQSNWKGLNLLGKSLMRVRELLRNPTYEYTRMVWKEMTENIKNEIDSDIINKVLRDASKNG